MGLPFDKTPQRTAVIDKPAGDQKENRQVIGKNYAVDIRVSQVAEDDADHRDTAGCIQRQ